MASSPCTFVVHELKLAPSSQQRSSSRRRAAERRSVHAARYVATRPSAAVVVSSSSTGGPPSRLPHLCRTCHPSLSRQHAMRGLTERSCCTSHPSHQG